jgi:hypothetical protein
MLRRFWFSFQKATQPNALNMGCGITAYDEADARKMLTMVVFPMFGEQPIDQIIEGIDVQTLEANHVLPNIGNPAVRGVWYPALWRSE